MIALVAVGRGIGFVRKTKGKGLDLAGSGSSTDCLGAHCRSEFIREAMLQALNRCRLYRPFANEFATGCL
ncbi:hypothetical protein AFK24_20265 [Pseudomonas syringae]|uniref:Uncharacterized protein n=1 Tax=Pseudomonas syringae TaxID=317 RepID=A0A1C7Z5I0_PSESX|nr:hypothetical protein AFK24_20265 [Pseudomonas syringae]